MDAIPIKVFGLVRVSSERQRDNSRYTYQEKEILHKANLMNWDIEIIREVRSAKDMSKRPVLLSLLERLNNGEAKRLLILTSDRLTRSWDDGSRILKDSRKYNWLIHPLDLDPDHIPREVWEKLFRDAISNAHYELDVLSTRTKQGLSRCGKILGMARFTYPQNLIERVSYLKNVKRYSYSAIATILNKESFPIIRPFASNCNYWTKNKVAGACRHILSLTAQKI